jgi:hypothetical protein
MTLKWQCNKCGEWDETKDMNPKNLPKTCYSCCIEAKSDYDMNKCEEYLQGDHGYVISPNY